MNTLITNEKVDFSQMSEEEDIMFQQKETDDQVAKRTLVRGGLPVHKDIDGKKCCRHLSSAHNCNVVLKDKSSLQVFMDWLMTRPERRIAVVSHGIFLQHLYRCHVV